MAGVGRQHSSHAASRTMLTTAEAIGSGRPDWASLPLVGASLSG